MIDLPAALASVIDAIDIADIKRRHRLLNEQVVLMTAIEDSEPQVRVMP